MAERGPPSTRTIFGASARLAFPVIWVFALMELMNADTQPGEGFSAGVLVALAVQLLYFALGVAAVDKEMPRLAHFGVVSGWAILVLLGLLGLVLGDGFLANFSVVFPQDGSNARLSTALLFDAGIFLVLSGGTVALFRNIGLEKEDEP